MRIVQGSVLGNVTHNLKVLGRSPRRAGARQGADPNGVRILAPLPEQIGKSPGPFVPRAWGLAFHECPNPTRRNAGESPRGKRHPPMCSRTQSGLGTTRHPDELRDCVLGVGPPTRLGVATTTRLPGVAARPRRQAPPRPGRRPGLKGRRR